MNPSSRPVQAASESVDVDHTNVDDRSSIAARIACLARTATDRADFLRSLADELRAGFDVTSVFLSSQGQADSLVLAGDPPERLDRIAANALLESAAPNPIACDVPLGEPASFARALRVELSASPNRSAALLIYPERDRLTAAKQISALKTLADVAQTTRELIVDLPNRQRSMETSGQTGLLEQVADVGRQSLRHFHRDVDLNATVYRVANETRRLLGCDRVTVLIPSHRRLRVGAISGVSVVDRRSNSVRAAESLANRAAVMNRPLEFPGHETLPPQIQEPLDQYLDETGVASAIYLPLHSPDDHEEGEGIEASSLDPHHGQGETIAVLMLEYFSGRDLPPERPVRAVAAEATLAIRNSIEHHQVFGLTLWRAVGRWWNGRRRPATIAIAVTLIGLMIAATTIQIEHQVVASGNVQPVDRRQVFAAVDGIVKKIHVTDGQTVQANEPLFELENAELESRAESLAGEAQTASRRLSALRAMLLRPDQSSDRSDRWGLELRQLESDLAHLQSQQAIVRNQQQALIVTSPIKGTVIGWQLEKRFRDRPISRGDLLVGIVDYEGPWKLRLNLPDRDSGAVLSAAKSDPELAIRFAVATEPESSYRATLDSIGTAARLDESGTRVIDVSARVIAADDSESHPKDSFQGQRVRVDAEVTAKIACGQRSVLRSWFGDVFDFVNRNVLFYFRD